ncbi:MAG: Omp28-related outer membrane protein [bacterium]
MHLRSGYPLYCPEAVQRMYYYPGPYYTPWLYYDGQSGGSGYSGWESLIVDRMSYPACVNIKMSGFYNPISRTGTVTANFRNDSTEAITGRVYFVLTEDSLTYSSPNGDYWHNHVARDYLPDQLGETVTIDPGDSAIISRDFSIASDWNMNQCEIVTWIQEDGTRNVYQGGLTEVSKLIGINEEVTQKVSSCELKIIPNPCVAGTNFFFNLPKGTEYSIQLFDISGHKVQTLKGISSGNLESSKWDRRDNCGVSVCSGVYFYQFESKIVNTSGKVVVR